MSSLEIKVGVRDRNAAFHAVTAAALVSLEFHRAYPRNMRHISGFPTIPQASP